MSTLRVDTLQTTDSLVSKAVAQLVDSAQLDAAIAGIPSASATTVGVTNITALKSVDWSSYTIAVTKGYNTAGDGGHGQYYKDPTDTTSAENGVTVFVANDSSRIKLSHQGTVSVKQAGARGDGTTDDLAAFVRAFAATGVQVVAVPKSTSNYSVSGALSIPAGKRLIGDGHASTVIYHSSLTGNFITLGDGATVENVLITGSASRTGGVFISAPGRESKVRDVAMTNFFVGIRLSGTIITVDTVSLINAVSTSSYGVDVVDGSNFFLNNIQMDTAIRPRAGFHASKGGGVWMSNCDFIHGGAGMLLEAANTDTVTNFFIENSSFDSSSGAGIHMITFNTGAIRNLRFSNCWVATNNDGLLTQANGGDVDGVFFTNFTSVNNNLNGVSLNGSTKNVSFTGGLVSGNSQQSSLSSDGIYIGTNVSNIAISGVRVGPAAVFPDVQRYGINVATTAGNYISIVGNNLQTVQIPLIFGPTTGFHAVSDNAGALDHALITVTTNASGEATIFHQLGGIPRQCSINLHNSANPYIVQGFNFTPTQFTIKAWNLSGAVLANNNITVMFKLSI